ncbi:tandem-95 repeat protein [Psychrobacter faecalis]|uniref:tandem-95 repeat protein n=1 Tax=Psychrobacter faecalis TaxID=180588 RepID=UPI0018DF2072|nr:tandem-95 repeat protein [Psychrobacter faecalis]
MTQTIQLAVQKDNVNLINQALNSNKPTKIAAEEGMKISLVEAKTGLPAKKLKAKKVDDDLLIADENGETLLTIEDYYLTDNIQLGTVGDSGFVEFDYVNSETGVTSQIASETSYTTLVSEMLSDTSFIGGISNGVLLGSLGAAALGIAALSSGSSDDSPKTPANKIPVSKDSIITATEDTIAKGLLAKATDVDGDTLTYALATAATNGKVVIGKDGSYSYTPNANFNGKDSFTYTINDGQGGVITQTATVNVAAVNDAPVSANTTIAATEDTIAKGLLAKATDVDGDNLTYAIATGAANGKVVIGKDGSYSYTPNANFNGKDSFTYTVTDGTETITKTANITVASVNDLPVSKDSIITATEDTIVSGKLEAATDVDGDTLTYAIATNATNGKVVIGKDGSYSYTPNANFNGKDSFTYTITDGKGGVITQTATVNIAAVNDAPVSENTIITATEDTIAKGLLAKATDVDGDALTYAIASAAKNGTAVVNKDGSYSYTPNANFNGKDSFTYTVTDGTETITKTANITVASVNDVPVSKDTIIAATEDTIVSGKLEAATDADGDALTYAVATGAANGKVVIGKDGSYTYTPNADFNGKDTFTYTINDGQGGVITQTATVNVANVNDAPVSANTTIAATEDTIAKGLLAKATDVDGDALTYALATNAANGKVIIGKDGSYSYTPNANFNGKDSFTYTVTDGTETITKTANITVASVNDVPVSKDTIIAATEDTIVSGKLEAATDADGDALTYAVATGAANGKVVIGKDGSYTYTPNADFNGKDTFTYTINDGQGGVITQTATVNVANVNDAPVSEDSIIGVAENIVDTGVLAKATDVDGDTLTYTLLTEAVNGTVVVNKDGSYSYTPNTDFKGEDSFTYTVSDGNGGIITKTANVNVAPFDQKSNFELQEVFETNVVSEQQAVVEKQTTSYINEVIEFEITGQNGMPQLQLTNGSNVIQGNYSYTLQGPGISSSSKGSISSVGSNSYLIDFSTGTLPPGKYTLDLYVYSSGSSIDFNVTEFKDIEYTDFTGYQEVTGNIFADESGTISTPQNYEIQVDGQSLVFQTGNPAASPITVDTDNGKLTLAADGSYTYRSDRTDLGLEAQKLAEDFYVKVIDLDTKQAGHYGINITSDVTPPEPGELVFNSFEDTGISQDDGITSDRSFDLTVKDNEAGSQVEYQYSTDKGITWEVLANGIASDLIEGDYSFRAKVTDEALNESFTAVKDITIDTTAPILGDILNFNTATNQLEVNADIDQDTLQAFKLENGTLVPIANATNIPFAEGNYQIQASDIAGNSTTLDFVMSNASEYFESADIIDIVKGSAGNDYIYGGNGDDILISNGGSDHLYGEAGNDTLIFGGNSSSRYNEFNGGAGDDTYIIDAKTFSNNSLVQILDTEGSNRLDLKGFDPSDIVLTRKDSSLEISNSGGKITLGNQFDTWGVDNIYFDNGVVWDRATIEAMTGQKWVGTDGDDIFTATSDYSLLYGGDGNDTLKGGVNDDYIYGGGGDDILISNGGSDHLYGEAGNDTLIFGGNSSSRYNEFNGGAGDDTYIIDAKTFSNNSLVQILDTEGSNRLDLKGFDPSDIVLTRKDSSLEISNSGGKITLGNQFDTWGVDNIYFDNGVVWDRAYIESMVNNGNSNARSMMSFDEAEDSSDDDSENDYFSESIDLVNDTDTYYDSSANLSLSFDSSVGQMETLIDSPQIQLPSINDLLDLNSNELIFEQTDVGNATPSSDNNVTSVFEGATDNTAMAADFTMMHVQDINDMQTEAMFHIM